MELIIGGLKMSLFPYVFSPIKIGSLTLSNRLIMAPMATHFATEKGEVTQKLIDYYVERGKGGVGLIVSESNYVSPDGRGGIRRLGLYCDELMEGHQKLTKAVHQTGAKICAQLNHVGRNASLEVIGQYPVSCSSTILLGKGEPFVGIIPRKLDIEEIRQIVKAFGKAAKRANEVGFDAVMIHGASGYLVNQFLSPYTNTRNDVYGKGFNGRIRFLLEIVQEIRKNVGNGFPIMVRLVADEKLRAGYRIDYIQKVAIYLEKAGVDEINITLGNYEAIEWSPGGLYFPQGYLSDYSKALKEKVKIPIGTVGRIKDLEVAERIIREKKADLVYMGRALIADPFLPQKAAKGKSKEIRGCIACNRVCIGNLFKQKEIACAVNPELGREGEKIVNLSRTRRKVVVVGGGPGGMEAAIKSAEKGNEVLLFEKDSELGGQLKLASLLPHMGELRDLIEFSERRLRKSRIKIFLNTLATEKMIQELKPDRIILATGATPIHPHIAGIDLPLVVQGTDVLAKKVQLGENIIILGGGLLGFELAEWFIDKGKKVTIVEQLKDVMMDAEIRNKKRLLLEMNMGGVKIFVNTRGAAIERDGLLVERFGGIELLRADNVIISVGSKAEDSLIQALSKTFEFTAIGDCVKPRYIMDAIHEGYFAGINT